MAQTAEGAIKCAAAKVGISVAAYAAKVANGEKWCSGCSAWHRLCEFGFDASRFDGRAAHCSKARRERFYHHEPIPPDKRRPMGVPPAPPRDGDKRQARQRINVEVRTGRRPHPNMFPCSDCGHIWKRGERRHEYDHYLGYAAEHHYDVQPVCTKCHSMRDNIRANATHCIHGHEFTKKNTIIVSNGTRRCLECRRVKDRKRHNAEYWREWRKRKANG